jgi:Protein of unknown function (DUF4230)
VARSVVVAGVVLVAILAIQAIPGFDLFGEKTIDRSQPTLLKSIAELSDYHAATANMEQIVDIEKDARLLPDFLKGEKVLFVAAGSVDAGVDFSKIEADDIQVSEDGTGVTITLPPAQLYDARVDPERSRVFDRERGLLDRVGSVFQDSPTSDRELFILAERKLAAAAHADPELLRTAEENTRRMLEGMMKGLGFERVTVRFEAPPV